MRTTALLSLLCAGATSAAEDARRPLLAFHGNVVFDELVYRSILDLPENAHATPAVALEISAKLRGFLRGAGYDLAAVHARVQGEQIAVEIDEGRLDKIVVLGQGLMETFRFKLELSMPANVFNRPILERQLRNLSNRYRLREYSYQLVPADVQEGGGAPVDEPEPLVGVPGLQPQRYQLHILIASSPWSRGFAPVVTFGSPEGVGAGAQYREQDLLVANDRWEAGGRVAAAIRQHLDSESSRVVLSRLIVQGRWLSPPLLTESLRPALTVRGDVLSLQRPDLRLDSFHQATLAASLDASVFWPRAMVALGFGIERRFLASLVKANGASPRIDETPRAQTRPYVEAIAKVVFNPGELRTDRMHVLDFEARAYTGSPSSDQALWLRASWQRRFPFGWHELWWQARGTLLAGQVLFADEEPIGSHLHGPFATSDFASRLASSGLEFRYSLLRDVFKVGVFYDQIIYSGLDRTFGGSSPRTAGAGGPTLHLLLADQFQFDFQFAVGWKTEGATDYAAGFVLQQVF